MCNRMCSQVSHCISKAVLCAACVQSSCPQMLQLGVKSCCCALLQVMDSQQIARLQCSGHAAVIANLPMLARLILDSLEPRLDVQPRALPGAHRSCVLHFMPACLPGKSPLKPLSLLLSQLMKASLQAGVQLSVLCMRLMPAGLDDSQASEQAASAGAEELNTGCQELNIEPAAAAPGSDTQCHMQSLLEVQAIMRLIGAHSSAQS